MRQGWWRGSALGSLGLSLGAGAASLPVPMGGGIAESCWKETPGIFPFAFSQWEAFSLPELQNFLRILDKEEDEQLHNLKRRYTAYRQKLEAALGEAWKPG